MVALPPGCRPPPVVGGRPGAVFVGAGCDDALAAADALESMAGALASTAGALGVAAGAELDTATTALSVGEG